MPIQPRGSTPLAATLAPLPSPGAAAPWPARLSLAHLSADSRDALLPARYGNRPPQSILDARDQILDGVFKRHEQASAPDGTAVYRSNLRRHDDTRLRVALAPEPRSGLLELRSIVKIDREGAPLECWLRSSDGAGQRGFEAAALPPALHHALLQESPPSAQAAMGG